MILDSVITLSSFPYEKIGVLLNDSVSPESSARFGIRFINNTWDYDIPQLNWGNHRFIQSGIEPDILNSDVLSDYYDEDAISEFVQPTNFCEIPEMFPLFFTTSAIQGDHVVLSFKGGTSAISIFPSTPYPVLEKLDDRIFSVSGGFVSLTAFSDELTFDQYVESVGSIEPLTNHGAAITFANHDYTVGPTTYTMYPDAYFSASRKDFVLKTQANKSTVNALTNQRIPAILPYSTGIVPESFQMTFTVSSANLEDAIDYTIGYGHTLGTYHYLSGLDFSNENITGADTPILNSARLDSVNSKLNLKLNAGYFVPKGEQYLVSYQASALPYIKSTGPSFVHGISGAEFTNYYEISSQLSPYFYNYKFGIDYDAPVASDEAFTIYFEPLIHTEQPASSAFLISTVMVDNYNQLEFPIVENKSSIRMRFSEANDDISLSAIDLNDNHVYTLNQWMPASAYIKFVNDGLANSFTVLPEISTFKNDVYYADPITFLVNKEFAVAQLSLSATSSNWTVVKGNIYPNYDSTLNLKWDVQPSNNIRIYDYFEDEGITIDAQDNVSVLPTTELDIGVLSPANEFSLLVNNLGIDRTKITVYSEEYDLSASTYWNPPSAAFNNISLNLVGSVDDMAKLKVAELSCTVIKNGMVYPAPNRGNIVWKETNNDPRGSFELFSSSDTPTEILENTLYPATNSTNTIDAEILVDDVDSNPRKIIFNFSANIFGNKSDDPLSDTYNLTDNIIIPVRPFPKNFFVDGLVSASNGDHYLLSDYNSIFFDTSSLTLTASVITSMFSSVEDVVWNVPGIGEIHENSVVFPASATLCITVSALSAQPTNNTFGTYNFADQLCINILPNGYPVLDYVAFPEFSLFPTHTLQLDDDLSYLDSLGLTALDSCSTNVTVSTFGGFDEYHYKIGTKQVSSVENIITIPVSYTDISATGVVQLTGYSSIFPKGNPLSDYNYVISDNSDIFHQSMSTVDFPILSGVFSSSNNNLNIRSVGDNLTDLQIDFTAVGIDSYGTYKYVLSSIDGIVYSDEYTFNNSLAENTVVFDTDVNNVFNVGENQYMVYNMYASGNIVKYAVDGPLCVFNQTFTTNQISISAYDGPSIEIYTPHHIYTTSDVLSVFNQTEIFPVEFSEFIFDDGNGTVTAGLTYTDVMTATYGTEGTYTISITGVHPIDGNVVQTWPNIFIIKDQFDAYDSTIIRTFPDNLSLPFGKSECLIKPNEWQWESTINEKLQNLYTNFEYISAMSHSWDINEPKNVIGWLGEKGGRTRWIYDTPATSAYYSDVFTDIKDINFVNDNIVIINGNTIEFHENDFEFTLLNSVSNITEGEEFSSPSHVVYIESTNKLVVLDNNRRNVFVFDVDNYNLILTHYWGGVGQADSRTHLNNPTDLFYDDDIFVVDSDSMNIKVYNQYLNWKNMIQLDEWNINNTPVSIASSTNFYYVLTTNGFVYEFDRDLVFTRVFSANIGNKIYQNNNFLYIINNGDVYVYTIDGIFVNTFSVDVDINRLVFDDKEIYAINSYSIIKIVDYAQKFSITDASNSTTPLEAIIVASDELVTSTIYNDSMIKLHNNLVSFANSLTNVFVMNLDEFDVFDSFSIETRATDEELLISSAFVPLGINEIVSYETINRSLSNVWNDLYLLFKMIHSRQTHLYDNTLCWTWNYHTINDPQNINDRRRPLSWKELASTSSMFSSALSAITWNTAVGCGYEHNHSPINWVWEEMSCNCIWPVTWEELECGKPLAFTWEELSNQCHKTPEVKFNSCLTDC